MELNKREKNKLMRCGYTPEDIEEIEYAINNGMEFTIIYENGKDRKTSAEYAKRIVGADNFLGGVSRAAFHASAIRVNEKNRKKQVYFNYRWW
jgi:hypothetical protein